MKLAIGGKGGVGKTTLAAGLAVTLARRGTRVLAVDADPTQNLSAALGLSAEARRSIVPISEQKALVEERTGAKVKQYGQMFHLNPRVDDLAQVCGIEHHGVVLLVLGGIEQGGAGCACPESVLLRALISDLVLRKNETLIIDFEAGIEHLGRATARGVDALLTVVEPGQRSLECAHTVRAMARDIGIRRVLAVANKVRDEADRRLIEAGLGDLPLIGSLPASETIREADRQGRGVLDRADPVLETAFAGIVSALETP